MRLHLSPRQRGGLFHGHFRALDRVDEVFFDARHLFFGNAFDGDDARALDERAGLLRQQLDTLRRAVRALIVLPVQKGDGKHGVARKVGGQLFAVDGIDGRFGKYVDDRPFQLLGGEALRVVADDLAHVFRVDAQLRAHVFADLFRLQILFLFYIYSVNHSSDPCVIFDADVAAVLHAFKLDFLDIRVRLLARLGDGGALGAHAEHPAAARHQRAVFAGGAGMV